MDIEDTHENKSHMSRRNALAAVASMAGLASLPEMAKAGTETAFVSESDNIFSLPKEAAASRQFTTFNVDTKVKAIILKAGQKTTLVDHKEPGIINRLWFTFSGWFWTHWDTRKEAGPDPTILKRVILRIYWDGNEFPSVETPLCDFFGIGLCEFRQFLSQYIGMSSGGFYSYFPMPFNKVKIEIENTHDSVETSVFMNANYQALKKLPPDAGRFHCTYNAGTNSGEKPLHVLKTKGKGKFVGCCVSMQGKDKNNLGFLEAPEYIYIDTDDRTKPTLVGTGLEDYYNGGWYFRDGEFSAPYHGVPLKDPLRSTIAMYRFHDRDAIGFDRNFEFSFINHRPPREFKFSSTAYWYQQQAVRLPFTLPAKEKLVDWYNIRDTDHQSIP